MFLLPCPYCGNRPQIEFSFHGDASIKRPSDAMAVSLDEWLDHIYLRNNPRGSYCEWWLHSAGCRRWIKIHRDTFDHRILEAGDAADETAMGEHFGPPTAGIERYHRRCDRCLINDGAARAVVVLIAARR